MTEMLSVPLSPQPNLNIARSRGHSIFVSFYLCAWTLVGFSLVSDRFWHWFVIPVLLCGVLISIDAVDWLWGRLDIFDPVGILGLLGVHFFFLAPFLHIYWDHWTLYYITPPPDWRDWLGAMAILNFLGLLVYRISRGMIQLHKQKQSRPGRWELNRRRFFVIVSLALVITALLQLRVYISYGGISGYIKTYEEHFTGAPVFEGMGSVFMISESFPILALMAFAVWGEKKRLSQSWVTLVVVLLIFLVLKLFFGGLRGSRSNTIWGLFWAVGIIHYWLRPVSKKFILGGCLFLVFFMYGYGFYKANGLEGLVEALQSVETRTKLAQTRNRTLETAILGDFGRSDVQAFLLYRLSISGSTYKYAWGRTYLGTVAKLIPKAVWPDRPPGKVKEGTEALYGMGTYHPGVWQSFKVYGLAGEPMLNFGPITSPLAFALLGTIVALVRRLSMIAEPADSRLILLPFLVNLCFVILISDSDNILFFLIKDGAVPFLILAFSTKFTLEKSDPPK